MIKLIKKRWQDLQDAPRHKRYLPKDSTVAGMDAQGFADGDASVATFYGPIGITIDTHGDLYVSDGTNFRIRKITMH